MDSLKPNIHQSTTLPSTFYADNSIWEQIKESVFTQTWQWVGDQKEIFKGPENVFPLWLLEKYLDEPIVLIEKDNNISCFSNVCTHRGFILTHHPCKAKKLICGYHGRRFNLDGEFEFMPEFKGVEDFPKPCDNLHQLPLKNWERFLFTSIDPKVDFQKTIDKINERLGFLPINEMRYAPEYNKTYNVKAHWALYCDNYLEGFHIPFVHQTLNEMLSYGDYATICHEEEQIVLQIGYSDSGSETFDLPEGHPDFGKDVTAYYYWVFPNLMLNVYPWGIQVNVVKPINPAFCKVEFIYYLHDEEVWQRMGEDSLAEKVEREDEFVVEGVQRGLRSRFYDKGRFSPTRENGVHFFHRLLKQHIAK